MIRFLRKKLVFGLAGVLVSLWVLDGARYLWVGQTASELVALGRWGNASFDPSKFQMSENSRLPMTANLLARKQEFIGKNQVEIFSQLGRPDGYFRRGSSPAYILGKDTNGDFWQAVFLLSGDGRVSQVIIQKNCCAHGIQTAYKKIFHAALGVLAR